MKEKIDVKEIMDDILSRAKKRRMDADLQRLEKLDLKDIEALGSLNFDFPDASISNHLRPLKSHRKGVLGRVYSYFLRKLIFAVDLHLRDTIKAQEAFNIKVLDLLKKHEKYHEELDKPVDLGLSAAKIDDEFRGGLDGQARYLRFFDGGQNVLDIACGRGNFLEKLKEFDVKAFGVDFDETMVQECLDRNLDVVCLDALSYLKNLLAGGRKLDGIFSAQFVEHLDMPYLVDMLRVAYKLLEDGKFIVLETINIKSLSVFANSAYKDPTHRNFLHPEALKFILESIGFRDIEFIFSGEFDENEKLQKIDGKTDADRIYNSNLDKLNELLFAPQDYAVIAKK